MLGDKTGDINTKDEDQSEYDEKKWGKEEGGKFIVDGFTFKGKRTFQKAKEGLAEQMKKGVQGEENGIKFKVLDSRQKGSGTEVDIEIVEQGARGIGLLKLYGPNKSKEYVVMVSKSKGSDNKFVTILAQKVVKPLMKKYLLMDDSKTEEVEKNSC